MRIRESKMACWEMRRRRWWNEVRLLGDSVRSSKVWRLCGILDDPLAGLLSVGCRRSNFLKTLRLRVRASAISFWRYNLMYAAQCAR